MDVRSSTKEYEGSTKAKPMRAMRKVRAKIFRSERAHFFRSGIVIYKSTTQDLSYLFST